MLKLIQGEIYRVLHKKSMYVYFGVLAIAYILLAFIRSGGFSETAIVKDAITFFSFCPALVGGFLFAAIYSDDLNSKNLITLVGFGIGKTKIVLAKFMLAILFGMVCFGIMPLFHSAVYALFGYTATASQIAMLYAVSLKFLLMTLAYCTLSSIVVYGLQRATFAVVAYILFSFSVISTLLIAVINILGLDFYSHLFSGITDRIMTGLVSGGPLISPVIEYCAFVLMAVAFSALSFSKKEMEF
jgi:ABC-type transport system involved in multi-copper enzyme maturation permease subunit